MCFFSFFFFLHVTLTGETKCFNKGGSGALEQQLLVNPFLLMGQSVRGLSTVG